MSARLPDDLADALAAFTREIEVAQANLLQEVRQELRRLDAAMSETRAAVASLAERLAALEGGTGPPVPEAGPPALPEDVLGDEARERMRWRHPDIWKLAQAGFAPEGIAERSQKTLGEVRLILHMMGARPQGDRGTVKEE